MKNVKRGNVRVCCVGDKFLIMFKFEKPISYIFDTFYASNAMIIMLFYAPKIKISLKFKMNFKKFYPPKEE
jgi:hypothetical protein